MQNIIKIHEWAEPYVNFLLGETSPFNRKLYKQTVETLIRHRFRLQRLIQVCTICLCPRKRTLISMIRVAEIMEVYC